MNVDDRDEELAAAAAKGDRAALDALLRRHAGMIHAVCRRVLANPDDALDASQDALLAIARRIDTFDGRSKFTTWCYRVATNAALDEVRRGARRPVPAQTVPEPREHAPAVDDATAERLDVDAALARLSPSHRAAVALRDLVGLDYAEIATVLDIPPGTVRSRIARGRAALADHIGSPRADHKIGRNQTPPSEHPTSRTS
ncbi:MAG: RNA polymerase sigma factor [Acidimicrobiia bacterium]